MTDQSTMAAREAAAPQALPSMPPRWFVRSFGDRATGAGPQVTDPAERRGDSLEKVLGVLMATSIRSSALYTTRWAVAVTGGQ